MTYNFDKYDVFLAENNLTYKTIRKKFLYKGEILCTGMPRNDCLLNYSNVQKKNIRNKIGASQKYMLLYAPTFRDHDEADCFSIDFAKVRLCLENKFGGSWEIAFKYHPLQKKRNLPGEYIELSEYDDMQELLISADILITDYSSCMWDFSLMKKPCFIYASDIDRYIHEDRGAFLYPIDKLPFPIARNNKELKQQILDFNQEEYENQLKHFHDEWGRYNFEGNATECAVNRLLNKK